MYIDKGVWKQNKAKQKSNIHTPHPTHTLHTPTYTHKTQTNDQKQRQITNKQKTKPFFSERLDYFCS